MFNHHYRSQQTNIMYFLVLRKLKLRKKKEIDNKKHKNKTTPNSKIFSFFFFSFLGAVLMVDPFKANSRSSSSSLTFLLLLYKKKNNKCCFFVSLYFFCSKTIEYIYKKAKKGELVRSTKNHTHFTF